MTPLVSILIPTYNREAIIAETLNSALAQTYKNIEVIIVDNASTDNTWQVIQSFAKKDDRVKAFRNESNLGPVRNWKRCIDEASGEYGKILWSDDLIAPDFLEKTLSLLTAEVGFVYSGAKIFTTPDIESAKTSYLLPQTGLYPSQHFIKNSILEGNVPVSPGCAIFRISDLKKNLWVDIPNKINSDFSMHAIGNDLLLLLLTAQQYKKVGFSRETLAYFRAHKDSISIESDGSKLRLHYSLARAYFVENFSYQYLNLMIANTQLILWKYKNHSTYNIYSISDFFQKPLKFNKIYLVQLIVLKLKLRLKYLLRRLTA